jgi:hypothetical protein
MGRIAVLDSKALDIRYAAFEGGDSPAPEARATLLFVSGTKGKPSATLNGKDVGASLRAWTQGTTEGWLVPLAGALPADDQVAARLAAGGR